MRHSTARIYGVFAIYFTLAVLKLYANRTLTIQIQAPCRRVSEECATTALRLNSFVYFWVIPLAFQLSVLALEEFAKAK